MPEDMQEREGIPPYAQRDVEHAVNRAMSRQEWKERVRAGLPIANQAGGAMDKAPMSRGIGERGEDREIDRNIEALLRSHEADEYDPTVRVIRKHRSIYAIRARVREELAEMERTMEDFDDYRTRMLTQALRGSARSQGVSSEDMEEYDLSKYGYRGTPEDIKAEVKDRLDELKEMAELYEGLAKTETKTDLIKFHLNQVERYKRRAERFEKRYEDELKDFPRHEQQELAKGKGMLAEEIRIRGKTNYLDFRYQQAAGDMSTLVNLFIDNRYASMTSRDVETLFSLAKTRERENYSFGEKEDLVMRALVLLAIGSGDNGEEDLVRLIEKVWHYSREAGNEQSWIEEWVFRRKFTDDEIKGRKFTGLPEFKFFVGKNLFCGGAKQSSTEVVREEIAYLIGGNKVDTRATVDIAWTYFYIWGFAPQFDNKSTDAKIFEKAKSEGRYSGKRYSLPAGTPDTDDMIKIYQYNAFLAKDALRGRPHGPDATLDLDLYLPEETRNKYPDHLTHSFLHSLKTGSGEKMRSFFEKWLYEGVNLGDLPWAQLGDEPEAQMIGDALDRIYQNDKQRAFVSAEKSLEEARKGGDKDTIEKAENNLVKARAEAIAEADRIIGEVRSKSQGTYSWRHKLLQWYMLGREPGHTPDKPGGLWHIFVREGWKFGEIMNVVTLLAINKHMDIGLDISMLSGGEWAEWFDKNKAVLDGWVKKNMQKYQEFVRINRQDPDFIDKRAKRNEQGEILKDNQDNPIILELNRDDAINGVDITLKNGEQFCLTSLIDEKMDEKKMRLRELILFGAYTRDVQLRGRAATARDWGIWIPTGMAEKSRLGWSATDETVAKYRQEKLIPTILEEADYKINFSRFYTEAENWAKNRGIE